MEQNNSDEIEKWFEQIYEEMSAKLLGYIQSIVHEHNLAEDILQNVMIRLLQTKQRGYKIQKLTAFLFTLARHEALRELEHHHYSHENYFPSNSEDQFKDGCIFEAAEPQKLSHDEIMAIEESLFLLPQEQREIVYLKIYANMTFAEIAECLNIPANTAASRYRYALEKISEILGE